ncbi:flavin-containing monooxygenase [Nakamurella leprariae]|uniref:NAD(P)/FAD-dependent oxidoreductase n=1 Tax=Nakamurella leprariae TaxID=2803911 RepID=A0A938YDW2_9ACTN|nr:NAD(P)/FAD-dependent oxidoreductase [Nakamurella leprariae]MBM9467773.1 NAD(P)/FAD-dependent oxidoreductase [Nakamurella leprariae]
MNESITVETVVIGAGFGGLAAAHDLLAGGRTDFLVLEQATSVGGVWRENVYPNAACDVPSHLYSLSFAQSPDWSSSYASQAEILAYTERVVDDLGIRDRILFGTGLVAARWDEHVGQWGLETSRGARITCRFLISAIGTLNQPLVPDLPGMDEFTGTIVHTARWDPALDLRGKRVAVVGAGASAIQVVPHAVERADAVLVAIRTPPHVMPKPEEHYDERAKQRFREHPELLLALRQEQVEYWNRSTHAQAVMDEAFLSAAEAVWRQHMESAVHDAELRRILTPTSRFGCRRPVVSNAFYPALADPRTTVFDSAIARLTPTGVVSERGQEWAADVVVLATGFRATEMLSSVEFAGTDGTLAEHWQDDGPRAYKGTLVPGFPNLFLVTGPNTQASGSIIGVIEAQTGWIARLLDETDARGAAAVGVTTAGLARFEERLAALMSRSVWEVGGCESWYRLGGTGRVVTKWPGSLAEFEAVLAEPVTEDLEFTGVRAPQLAARP